MLVEPISDVEPKKAAPRTEVQGSGTQRQRRTKEYRAWSHIKSRCFNPKVPCYKHYGARGITMYSVWADSYDEFYRHVGRAPTPKHSIDRIDNNVGYFPGNVRWATKVEQANNKSNNALHTLNRETKTFAQWCAQYGMDYDLVWSRLHDKGWTLEKSLTEKKRNSEKFTGEKGERLGYRDFLFQGQVKSLKGWAEHFGINHKELQRKVVRGWHMEPAIKAGLHE